MFSFTDLLRFCNSVRQDIQTQKPDRAKLRNFSVAVLSFHVRAEITQISTVIRDVQQRRSKTAAGSPTLAI